MLRRMTIHRSSANSSSQICSAQGFTLIELLVALTILTVGLLSLATLQLSSMRGTAFAGGVTESTTIATDRLEKLLALPYNHADLTAGAHVEANPPKGYSIDWSVTDNSPLNDTKTVNLTVTRTTPGVQKRVSMQRVIARLE